MPHKPWYQQAAEIQNQNEREEFIKGVFGFRPKEKHPFVAGLIGGYIGAKIATRKDK